MELVPLDRDDAVDMVDVLSGDDLYAYTGGSAPTLDELRTRYAALVVGHSADGSEDWYNWVLRRSADGRALGYVQATVTDEGSRAELAWVVGLEFQGRGYATEAVDALVDHLAAHGVRSLLAKIDPAHDASAAVARRVGLRPTKELDDGEQVWRAELDETTAG